MSPLVRDVSSVFNPAAFRHGGGVRLVLRVQTRGRETVFMAADSDGSKRFLVQPRLLPVAGLDDAGLEIFHVYDLRTTLLDGEVLGVFAVDTDAGCRLGTARLPAGDRIEMIGLDIRTEARNGVLFPEKIGGGYLRLERPNLTPVGGGVLSGSQIRLAESDDLVSWRPVAPVMAGRPHFWDELIGSGPPPLKTRDGWLHIYHGVATHFAAGAIYQAGVCLLDLRDPSRLLARGRNNILEPREPWEVTGQVPNVVFPTGMIVDEIDAEGFARPDSPVRVYYGAADTCIGMAETTVDELLEQCRLP